LSYLIVAASRRGKRREERGERREESGERRRMSVAASL
jgi:hypothetical protein